MTTTSRLRSGVSTDATMDESNSEDATSEAQELQQKLTMATVELEMVWTTLTTELQQAKEEAEAVRQQAEAARRQAEELEREVERLMAERDLTENSKMRAELDKLRQIEDLRCQFDREREQHRNERGRDAAAILELKKELAAVKKLSVKERAVREGAGTPKSPSESPSERESD